jgi:hypothetical protein
LTYADGSSEQTEIPLAQAPIGILVPTYEPILDDGLELFAICRAEERQVFGIDEFNRRFKNLLSTRGVSRIDFFSNTINTENFLRVLWKISVGFFWLTDPVSLYKSTAVGRALGTAKVSSQFIDSAGKECRAAPDVFSVNRELRSKSLASARVYSLESEENSHIYCEVDILGLLAMPLYICRIPSATRRLIRTHTFDPAIP